MIYELRVLEAEIDGNYRLLKIAKLSDQEAICLNDPNGMGLDSEIYFYVTDSVFDDIFSEDIDKHNQAIKDLLREMDDPGVVINE